MNLKANIAAIAAVTSVVCIAADETLKSAIDLGKFSPSASDDGTVFLQPSGGTNTPFTLSQDMDFKTLNFNVNSGSAMFDFSDGNHTIKVKSFRAANRNAPWVILKGGTWDLGTGSGHDFRFVYNTAVDGRTILLDSSTVTNADFMFGIQGTNNTLTLQNGACLYARAYRLTTPGAVATTHYTNNMIFVKGESSLLWGNSDFAFDYGGSTDEKTHSAMYVSGRSVLKSIGGSASFILGLSSSGNEVYVDGGSRLEVPRGVTIGNADNAKYNVMTVSGKSAVTNGYSLTIGSANGADHNRLEFLDSEYYGGEYNGIYVGEKGSFNELVVSNSAIKRCWFCCAGFDAAASNNTVRFVGPNASIGGSRYNMILFGSGHHNKFVLDGASIGRESSDCYFASSGGDSDEIASISNELQVANGGVFSEKSMKMHEGSVGNRIFVGASSAIRTAGDLNVRGRDNRVVVSNGTLYVSQSGSSMRFGKSTNDVDETGNMLVLQGTSPKVARIDPNNNYPSQFYNGSVLRFEVPPAGYEGVVFDRVEVKMYGTARLEFTGVEECHRTIFSSQDYQLSSSPFTILDFEGQDVTDSALETVSATLPAGCRVYRNASKHLHLKVKGNRGFHIIFR